MNPGRIQPSTVSPSSLVSVAFLKTKFDEGGDQLDIFTPFVLDVISSISKPFFLSIDIQRELLTKHGLSMLIPTVETILKRSVNRRILRREDGQYSKTSTFPKVPSIEFETARIRTGQETLANALIRHAKARGHSIANTADALDLLVTFIDNEQMSILLGDGNALRIRERSTLQERLIVAEFVSGIAGEDPALLSVLNGIVRGLVLYQSAFLPSFQNSRRRFKDLSVYFDSTLVRQALGLEGPEMQALLAETIQVLTNEGIKCLVFDKTIEEIHRILDVYEGLLANAAGRRKLRHVPMARYFLTNHFTSSDIRGIATFLEQNIAKLGITRQSTPPREARFTSDEKALAERITDPRKDESDPRVVHDVDCVAAILTLRRGLRPTIIEEARALFVTSSSWLVRNVRSWYEETETTVGFAPIAHLRALSNLAWLKKPNLAANLTRLEIVTLCFAALRPTNETWMAFLKHLDKLEASNEITSDEAAAIYVSSLTDGLLRDAELYGDVDAVTLDEVVERVKARYAEDASAKLDQQATALASANKRADDALRNLTEQRERQQAIVNLRAGQVARFLSILCFLVLSSLIMVGISTTFLEHVERGPSILVGAGAAMYLIFESFGVFGHLTKLRSVIEALLIKSIAGLFRSTDN